MSQKFAVVRVLLKMYDILVIHHQAVLSEGMHYVLNVKYVKVRKHEILSYCWC
jgi:hypothetical protein